MTQKLPPKIEEALDSLPVDIREGYDKIFEIASDQGDEFM